MRQLHALHTTVRQPAPSSVHNPLGVTYHAIGGSSGKEQVVVRGTPVLHMAGVLPASPKSKLLLELCKADCLRIV